MSERTGDPGSCAVLDACVLFPAALRDTLLRAFEKDLYRAYWSQEILAETTRNLVQAGRMTHAQASTLAREMTRCFPEAMVDGYEHLIPTLICEEKDRHVLAVAIQSGSRTIVTANLKDFPSSALRPYRIQAKAPDTFLSMLYNQDPQAMTLIILEQAADLHRVPATPDRILKNLELHAPAFVGAIRAHIEADEMAPSSPPISGV